MAAQTEGGVLERTIRIAARPETIFPFLVDPDKMARWQGMKADLDPRPGGVYRCEITPSNCASGAFVAVEPPHRVVYTFGWEGEEQLVPPGSSTVEIMLTADGDGTILRLRHFGLPAVARESHNVGWEHYLSRLAAAGIGRDPGADPWAKRARASVGQNLIPTTRRFASYILSERGMTITNFVLLYSGGGQPQSEAERTEVLQAWGAWFSELGGVVTDPGNPFMPAAKSLASDGMVSDGPIGTPASGYSIIKADSLDAATAAAKGCPLLKSGGTISVYEVHPAM